MALQHRFVARMDHEQWWLSARVDDRDGARRELPPDHVWLATNGGLLGVLHGVVARALRFFGYALLLSPLLVPVHIVARLLSPLASGLVVVAFVCLVVAFFATLNVFMVVAAIRYVVSAHATLRLWGRDAEAVRQARERLFAGAQPATAAVAGEVVRIGAPSDGEIVLRELVSRAKSLRVLEACDFAVYTDAGEYVVVRIEDAPLLLARREPHHKLPLPEGTRAALADGGIVYPERERSLHAYLVRVGDRVTVTGTENAPIERVDRFELGGKARGIKSGDHASAPYRGARAEGARMLRCGQGAPMLIVHVGGP